MRDSGYRGGYSRLGVLRECISQGRNVEQHHIGSFYRIPQAYAWADKYPSTPDRPLLDMSQGVPGVPPPKTLLDALANASSAPTSCGYLPNAGDLALREAIVQEMKTRYGQDADVTPADLVLTAGCNMAFCATAMTLADAGDEVILPVPW